MHSAAHVSTYKARHSKTLRTQNPAKRKASYWCTICSHVTFSVNGAPWVEIKSKRQCVSRRVCTPIHYFAGKSTSPFIAFKFYGWLFWRLQLAMCLYGGLWRLCQRSVFTSLAQEKQIIDMPAVSPIFPWTMLTQAHSTHPPNCYSPSSLCIYNTSASASFLSSSR